MTRRRRGSIALAAAGVLGVCCGIAFAALPFSGDGNTINGCYSDNGKMVLLTPKSPECPKKYHPIQWNVAGPQGLPGADGTDGVSPSVRQLAPGNPHCPAGGAAITDASNTTAFVCSGTPFSGTFTAGDYSISVTRSGITLDGPASEKITLTDTGIVVDGGPGSVRAKAATAMTLESSTQLNLKSTVMALESSTNLNLKGILTKVEGTSILDLTGALTKLGGGCRPVARVGDLVMGTAFVPATPFNASIIASITQGSPRVLSC